MARAATKKKATTRRAANPPRPHLRGSGPLRPTSTPFQEEEAINRRQVVTEIPVKLRFLTEMHRYKVAYGGRGAAKSHSFARVLLNLGANQRLRILCAREIQRSIKDSVHKLLSDCIAEMGLGRFYKVLETEIRGVNGTEFIFSGLAGHTIESIKSFEGIDIVWVEEAHTVSKKSWEILIPTIRAENSEIWVSFNPDMDSDETYKRFVLNPPEDAVVEKMTWRDNPWFPDVLEQERLDCKRRYPDDYDNIWEGVCRTVVIGAIYAREMTAMVEQGRFRPTPYDPRMPVHCIWDLGWNDSMAIIMVQKPTPTSLAVVNYIEDSHRTYAEYVADMERMPYRWGYDWLPHDASHANAQTGKDAATLLRGMGRRVRVMQRTDVESRIRAARMMFPRVYMDDTERKVTTGYCGPKRLAECLRHYRRNVPKTTEEPATPMHDQYSHGADAWGAMAEIVDQIRNDDFGGVRSEARTRKFSNADRGMGLLG